MERRTTTPRPGWAAHRRGAARRLGLGQESAGLGVRESSGLVTDEYARFLPHVIL